MVQCGVACFCYDKALQRYDVRAYNFYLWPEMSSTFSLQSDSLRFLSSHGFDFNRLIAEGIQYLTPVEEAAKRNKMETWLREEEEAFKGSKGIMVRTGDDWLSSSNVHQRLECF